MDFLNRELEEYIEHHSTKENDLLSELNRETWAKVLMPRMLSGHIQGRVLSLLSNLTNASNIIEIGTYTGYSALCLAEGIKKNEASCSKTAAKSSCCKSKNANKEVNDDIKVMNKKASERVRLAIANNEISAEEGRVRLAKLNEKKKN